MAVDTREKGKRKGKESEGTRYREGERRRDGMVNEEGGEEKGKKG